MNVSYKELKEAVKALNGLEIEELNVLRSVGVKRAILEQQFIEEVEKIADEYEDNLPDIVVNVFNTILEAELNPEDAEDAEEPEEAAESEPEEKPEKKTTRKAKAQPKKAEKAQPKKEKPKKAKKAEPKPEPKPEAKPKKIAKDAPRSRYGHIASALSGMLDEALYEGGSVAEIMKGLGIKRARVMSHIKHLLNDRGLTVNETPGESLNDTEYKVEEDSWEQQ